MHERGGLQRLVGRFIGHARCREFAQFAINQREQFIGGLWVAVLDGFQNAGDVAQSATITRCPGVAPENWASAAKGLKGKAHPFTALSAGPARCAELKGPRWPGRRCDTYWNHSGRAAAIHAVVVEI